MPRVSKSKPVYWDGQEIVPSDPNNKGTFWVFKEKKAGREFVINHKDGTEYDRYNFLYWDDEVGKINFGWDGHALLPLSNYPPGEEPPIDVMDVLEAAIEAAREAGWDVECQASRCETRTF